MSKFKKLYLPLLVSVAMNIGNVYASDANTLISMQEISQAIQERYASTNSTDSKGILDTLKQENMRYALLPGSRGISYFRMVSGFLDQEFDQMSNNLRYDTAPLFHDTNDSTYKIHVFKAIFENIDIFSQILSSFLDNGAQIHDDVHQGALNRIRALPKKIMEIETIIKQINLFREGDETFCKIPHFVTLSERFKWFDAAIPSTAREHLKKEILRLNEKMEKIYQRQVSEQHILTEDKKKADDKVIDTHSKK
ncbi:MAG: hypothetical protein NT128_00550 [Proteobacteria bacterium]|nr:hypothetical protein [Pseudomonadota bacterium]